MKDKLNSLGKFWNNPNHAAYLFMLPSILILLIFIVLPLVGTFVLSFTDVNLFFTNTEFIGFKNFLRFFQDERAINALINTLHFTLLETPAQVILGITTAFLLKRNTRFNRLTRSVYYMPVVISFTVAGIIWAMILDPNIGAVPYFLSRLGLPIPQFFRDPNMAMPLVAALTVWKNFGVSLTISLTAIQSIPDSMYEAAEIDGATKVQEFFHITIPQIIPTIGFLTITNLIGSMQVFDQIYITTGGGPQYATESAVMYIYSRGFSSPYELGYASALSAVLFIIIAIVTTITTIIVFRQEKKMN